jgi:hypothetical protein
MARIHILGASGSGTTTLGQAVAARLGVPHRDADDAYWLPTDPPYTMARPPEQRLRLLRPVLARHPAWVFSGSAVAWAAEFEPLYDLVVFVTLDPAERMRRLRARERARYGARIAPGGDMAASSAAFLAWAEAYDTAGTGQRSRALHEAWLADQRAPLLRLDSRAAVPALVETVLDALRVGVRG